MLQQRIQTFLEVANCLSFSTAAKNLYVSQQAVTRQIAALEQELGLRLFYRTTRAGGAHPGGSFLRDAFSQLNRQISDSIRKARELDASGKSLLRVGFLSCLSRKDIILPISDFLARLPQLEPDTAAGLRGAAPQPAGRPAGPVRHHLQRLAVLAGDLREGAAAEAVSGGVLRPAPAFQIGDAAVGGSGPPHPAGPAQRHAAVRRGAVGPPHPFPAGHHLPGHQHHDGTAGAGGGLRPAHQGHRGARRPQSALLGTCPSRKLTRRWCASARSMPGTRSGRWSTASAGRIWCGCEVCSLPIPMYYFQP